MEDSASHLIAQAHCQLPRGRNPGAHQFRSRNNLNETKGTRTSVDENSSKSTMLTVNPSLITVWLQVRVLPGPPVHQQLERRAKFLATAAQVPAGHSRTLRRVNSTA